MDLSVLKQKAEGHNNVLFESKKLHLLKQYFESCWSETTSTAFFCQLEITTC